MPFVFDATVGGATSTSYVTTEQADDYFSGRLNTSAWTDLGESEKQVALVAATSRLEQERYRGMAVTVAQRLKWPRYEVYDDDGRIYATDEQPRPLIEATCELALSLVQGGDTDRLALTGLEAFESISIGPISITPKKSTESAGSLPPQVARLLRGLSYALAGVTRLERA